MVNHALENSAHGEPFQIEYRVRNARGEWRWLYDRSIERYTIDGETFSEGLAADITEQKRAEQELRESEAKYRRLINILPSGIVVHAQGIIELVNRAGQRIFGANDAQELVGTRLIERVHPDYRAAVLARVRHTQNQNQEVELLEEKLLRLDGSAFDAEVAAIGLTFDGKPATLAVFNDISERKQRETELEIMVQISGALRTAETRAEMLPIVANEIMHLVPAAAVALILHEPHTHDYVIEYAGGAWQGSIGRRIPENATILQIVRQHNKPYVTSDFAHDLNFYYREFVRDLTAFASIPLHTHQTFIGVISIAGYTPFGEHDMRVIEAISNIAANALHRASLHEQTVQDAQELLRAYESTLEGWAHALELRDQETEGHTRRVLNVTLRLARAMGLPKEAMENIRRGALLHDIGKMGIPDSVLLKPGTLNEREWEIMRRHPEYARNMLMRIEYLHDAIDIPYCHHEKWDGTGYPRGLHGTDIPLAARIFAVVDVWDALLSDRPYRKGWSAEQTKAYLHNQSGKQFDPAVVEAFLKLLEEMQAEPIENT